MKLKRRHSIMFGDGGKIGKADSQEAEADAGAGADADSGGGGGAPAPKKAKTGAKGVKGVKAPGSIKRVPTLPLPAAVKSPFEGATVRATGEFSGGQKLQVIDGNIVRAAADCIVNSADRNMQHLHGLCGILAQEAGKALQKESNAHVKKHGELAYGEVVVTTAGDLDRKSVV